MTRHAWAAVAAISLVVLMSGPASALVCPVPAPGADPAQAKEIAAAIPAGDAFDDVVKLNAAVAALRAKGIGNAILVDSLIASYCPAVARNTALNDEQKRVQVRHFAARVTRVVYALDSVDAVILDVPVPPDVLAAINARAAAEKVSPEAWIANAVDRALKQAR